MQLRQLTLPVGFFALASAWPAPLFALEFSPRLLAVSTLFFGSTGAVACTATWLAVVGDDPSPNRGAVVATFASLVGAVVILPAVTLVAWLLDRLVLGGGVDAGPNALVGAMILGLVALALSPLAAALGYAVAGTTSLSLPRPSRLDRFDLGRLQREPTTRTLLVVFALLAVAVAGAGVVQYTDPTTPAVGDGPAYAGPDAPAATQVEQAQSRTRSVSHTVVVTTVSRQENGSLVERTDPEFAIRHDRESDAVLGTVRSDDGTRTHLLTVDGHWFWTGNHSTPQVAEMKRVGTRTNPSTYSVDASLDAPVRVLERTDDVVTIRYERPGGISGDAFDAPGNRTVRIDAGTGRLLSFTDRRIRDDGVRAVVTVDYRKYGRTSVDPPRTPVGPPEQVLRDLMHGPLTGEGTLH